MLVWNFRLGLSSVYILEETKAALKEKPWEARMHIRLGNKLSTYK